jgi:hypothetical protein
MKIVIYILTVIAIMIALTFMVLIYRQQQATPTPEAMEKPIVETEVDIASRILINQLNTGHLSSEDKAIAEASAKQQIEDDARLYDMAIAAGTTVSDEKLNLAWQSELYNHTDEAGLAAYIASLGLTEEQYRALILRRLTTTTFIESKANARVTDQDVKNAYDALSPDEREDFEYAEVDIRARLVSQALAQVRAELLAQ